MNTAFWHEVSISVNKIIKLFVFCNGSKIRKIYRNSKCTKIVYIEKKKIIKLLTDIWKHTFLLINFL